MPDDSGLLSSLVVFAAGACATALNAVAGGGTFIAFPTLLFLGVPPIAANATCTIAVWPGSLASVFGYRKELQGNAAGLPWMMAVGLVGGLIGALLLLATPERTFEHMIPWLLLAATLLFAFGKRLTAPLVALAAGHARYDAFRRAAAGALLFITALYGGYFGAGLGILLLAALGLLGMENIHRMNAVKTTVAAAINGMAVVTFLVAGAVMWRYGVWMIAGGVLGGYVGARLALRFPPAHVRRFVIAVATAMTAYFFWKYYG